MLIRPADRSDGAIWARMRDALWPADPGEHARAVAGFFAGTVAEPMAVFVAVDDSGAIVGFIELSIRHYAEGCVTDRVAYIEGWYVEPAARRRGVGAALVQAAEAWGRSQGCAELGSDAEAGNTMSADAHRALGFAEAGLIRCFIKSL